MNINKGLKHLKKVDEKMGRLIAEFEKITGIPVVLNTSFNVNGEPIVLTPDDAISTFFNSGVRYLVIDGLLVEK